MEACSPLRSSRPPVPDVGSLEFSIQLRVVEAFILFGCLIRLKGVVVVIVVVIVVVGC